MKIVRCLSVLFTILIALQGQGQTYYLGLGNTKTTDLFIYGDTIYAGTYDGIFKKNLYSFDTNWTPCGLQGNHVVQIVAANYQKFIAVVEIGNLKKTRIHKSINGGNTFSLILADTSFQNNYQYLDHIAYSGNNIDTIYSLCHMKKTFNGGNTWSPILYSSLRFIKVHAAHSNELFMGGETMIFSPEIKHSSDFASTFSNVNMSGFFGGDNSVHDMEFVENRWIGVGEGVISYTDDNGTHWNQAINTWSYPAGWGLYILDIEKSKHGNLYASGESFYGNRVNYFASNNNGESWDTVSFPSVHNINPSIKCIALFDNVTSDYLFLGGNGVYLTNNPVSHVNEFIKESKISIYPNPSSDGNFYIQTDDRIISWTIYNMLGQPILSGKDNTFQLQKKNFYIIIIETNRGRKTSKIMYQ